MTEMVYADYELLVDWNNDGDYVDAGEDISADVISAEWGGGFSNPLARVAGVRTATFVLDNTGGTYSPELDADVLPRRPVRFSMTYGATTVTQYEGYLDSIDPSHAAGQPIKAVTLSCVDATDRLDRFEGEISLLTNVRADDIIEDVVAAVYTPGSTDYDAGINLFATAADRWDGRLSSWAILTLGGSAGITQTVRASDKILDACASDWGQFFVAKNGAPTYRNRHQMPFDATTALTMDSTMTTIRYIKSAAPVLNYVAVTCYPRKIGQVTEILGELDQSNAPLIEAGGSVTFDIRFRDSANPAIGLGGLTVITPVENTDFEATDDEPGEGTDVASDITPSMTAYGDHAEITLANGGAAPAYVQKLQVRGIAVRSQEPVTVVAEDATSKVVYGTRDMSISAVLMSNAIHAQNLAGWLLDYYKDPLAEVGVGFSANTNATLMAAARDLELLDKVVLTEAQTGLSSAARHIYNIRHRLDANKFHSVELDLMEAYDYGADRPAWDSAKWDTDIWVY